MSDLRLTNSADWSLLLDVTASVDGVLLDVSGTDHGWGLEIARGTLLLTGSTPDQKVRLDMEDTVGLLDGFPHQVAIVSGDFGSRIYLDGYQCFSSTAQLSPVLFSGSVTPVSSPGIVVHIVKEIDQVVDPMSVLAAAPVPEAAIEFAADRLADFDVADASTMTSGTLVVRYRTRGNGQGGTIVAGGYQGNQVIALNVDANGLTWVLEDSKGRTRSFFAPGVYADGSWHDVAVRVAHGAVDMYVDGYLIAHHPGSGFFGHTPGLDTMVIGQDCAGMRLFGEARSAAIFPQALNDAQIKRLANVTPLVTQCLFDYGYQDSVSYRIPSVLTTASGVVIAGADQRETHPNDAPNKINFVIRRSLDGGTTFEDPQTVITLPGEGALGASVIDSCPVQDPETGEIIVLIDHFPGGIGQPNNEPGRGVTDNGDYILTDGDGVEYVWLSDGRVTVKDTGELTDYVIDENGNVNQGGNVFLADGVDPNQTLLTARTSYLWLVTSDDDGETFSAPRCINHMVKEEWMPFLGTGPGCGIALKHGTHAGRLVIPIYYNNDVNRKAFSAAVIYSDDHGKTWTRSASPNDGRITDHGVIQSETLADETYATHEATLVERQDGAIVMLMRNQHPSGRVARCVSTDGGATFGPVDFVDDLPEIFCQPNAIAAPCEEFPNRMVFANASRLMPYRGCGVLRVSFDGGDTWPAFRTFNPAHYVYQCMSLLPDGRIGLFWERETQGLYFTAVDVDWITG